MKITFDYDNTNYELEFTAASVKAMEKNGFNFAEMDKKPLSLCEDLFIGSFIAHHPTVPLAKRKEIFEQMKGQSGDSNLLETLVNMASRTIENIMQPNKGNISWEVK